MAKTQETVIEKVKFFAVNKKYKEKPFLATAVTDPVLRKFITGQEHLSAAELSRSELVIDPKENYMLRNNDELTLERVGAKYNLTRDYALYCLFSIVPEIARSKDDVIAGTHLFYMQNLEREAEKNISDAKVRAKAYAKVTDLISLTDMSDMLFYFGETAARATTTRAEAKIYELVERTPNAVLEYFDKSEESRQLVFVKKLIYYGLIKKQTNGYLFYGDIMLGADEKEASIFLYDDKNSKIIVPLKDQLDKAMLK